MITLQKIKKETLFLFFAVLGYAFVYFLNYPPIFLFRDEAHYLSMAYALKEGSLLPLSISPQQPSLPIVDGRLAPLYPLGNSLALMPWLFIGWKLIFFHGLLWHILSVFLIYRLAKVFEAPAFLAAILYLFYPPFIFYSRTVMADIPSVALFLAGSIFYFQKNSAKWPAGVFWGISLLFRITNIVPVIPFALAFTIRAITKREIKNLFSFSAGFLPFCLIQMFFQYFYFKNPFATGYQIPLSLAFTPQHFFEHFSYYTANLMLSYPFLLGGFLFSKKTRRPELIGLLAVLLLFFSFYYFYDRFPHPLATLIFANRFLFSVIPFLILGYADLIHRILDKFGGFTLRFFSFLFFLLLGACILISRFHQKTLLAQEEMRKIVYSSTSEDSILIYDHNAAELIQSVFGNRLYVLYPDQKARLQGLAKEHPSKKIYLIQRDVRYADNTFIPGLIETEISEINQNYTIENILNFKELKLFSLTQKAGNQT